MIPLAPAFLCCNSKREPVAPAWTEWVIVGPVETGSRPHGLAGADADTNAVEAVCYLARTAGLRPPNFQLPTFNVQPEKCAVRQVIAENPKESALAHFRLVTKPNFSPTSGSGSRIFSIVRAASKKVRR
jgi:hypothetical protein